MQTGEFKYVIFKTEDQWKSGLLSRLRFCDKEGLTLFSRPTFENWLLPKSESVNPLCIGVDPCGTVYWIDKQRCQLYSFNQISGSKENIPCIGGCGSGTGEVTDPARIIIDKNTMWLLDRGNRRILAFDTDLFQQKYIITSEQKPVDFTLDNQGYLYVLEESEQSRQIAQYHIKGTPTGLTFGQEQFLRPKTMAIGEDNLIYVADLNRFLRFSLKGEFIDCVGDFSSLSHGGVQFEPELMVISDAGSILVIEKGATRMHEFGALGGYLGQIQLPATDMVINSLVFDNSKNLYVGTDRGIAKFSLSQSFVGEEGIYYSPTLDKGIEKKSWHRLEFEFVNQRLPENAAIEVSYYSSDDMVLRNLVDAIIDESGQSVRQRIDDLESLLSPYWETEQNVLKAMLFRKSAEGRFLWLKLSVTTFDPAEKPSIKSMKVYYPRLSYLRYLPAVYQEDPVSRDFLERFLSLFETIFYDLELNILSLFQYFNPETTMKKFLPWLAGWLNMSFEEAWKEQTKRNLIQNAMELYKKKGTPGGIADFIELVVGQRPIIYENALFAEPFVLGGDFYVGQNIIVTKDSGGEFRSNEESIPDVPVTREAVGDNNDSPVASTFGFTVLLNLTREQFRRHKRSIFRILDEEKPAHTDYTIRLIADTLLGQFTFIGVNTRLTGLKPFCVGISSIPGKTVLNIKGEKGGRLERNSRIGSTLTLI
jgi:phage tail-like protein